VHPSCDLRDNSNGNLTASRPRPSCDVMGDGSGTPIAHSLSHDVRDCILRPVPSPRPSCDTMEGGHSFCEEAVPIEVARSSVASPDLALVVANNCRPHETDGGGSGVTLNNRSGAALITEQNIFNGSDHWDDNGGRAEECSVDSGRHEDSLGEIAMPTPPKPPPQATPIEEVHEPLHVDLQSLSQDFNGSAHNEQEGGDQHSFKVLQRLQGRRNDSTHRTEGTRALAAALRHRSGSGRRSTVDEVWSPVILASDQTNMNSKSWTASEHKEQKECVDDDSVAFDGAACSKVCHPHPRRGGS